MKNLKIAIIGASGLVGEKIIQILFEEGILECASLAFYVSSKTAGKVYMFRGKEYRFVLLDEKALNQKFDIVFFSAGDEVSRIWVEKFAMSGAYVIDNTNAFRARECVPLVVPEINIGMVTKETKIIANPNCSTIQLAVVINELKKLCNIKKIVVSTYQSVSGAGRKALLDLKNDTSFQIKEHIKDNVIAKIGKVDSNGFCTEENKIMFELNKILNENISICASTARVPIPFCHTESVYVKFSKDVRMEDIVKILNKKHIKVDEDISLPLSIADTNITHICRLRKFSKNEIAFFIVADNLRRGASYNAVMIAKYILSTIFSE